ncbi:MAG: glycosyltransferase family 1 protein [Actinobacteria bacterium]|nr:MAG: glycosyltransferase family 1 protein [Actinomycetota bacterium]
MSRFLIVVPPLAGHVNPTVAVGRELQRRGHEVAWAGHPELVAPLLPADCRLWPAGGDFSAADMAGARARWLNLRAFAALAALWDEVLIPLGAAMVDGVEAAVDGHRPDVVVADQQALAGAVVARRHGLPWATSASTFAELTRPYASMPKVETWVAERLEAFQHSYGVGGGDLRFSEHLVISYTVPELAGPVQVPCSPAFVGPALGERPPSASFPWEWLDPATKLVVVSLGTHNQEAGARFYRVLVDAAGCVPSERVEGRCVPSGRLEGRPGLQMVLVAPPEMVGPVPEHILVRPSVPQLALLARCSAVVTHGGVNTVNECLVEGVPMVLAPIRDDQPIVAGRVAAVGAGIQVRFGRVQPGEMAVALRSVLNDPAYRAAARRIGASFALAGGAPTAADLLEKLT